MKVTMLAMVVAVLVSSTVECGEAMPTGEALPSEEICEQIRTNKLRILTMGSRGRSLDDAHFYILVEGGYMFKVPMSNLRVDAANKTTSITIDQEIIRADALFNVSRDLFTRHDRFFLISNQNQDAFIGQIFFDLEGSKTSFKLYDLNGVLSNQDDPQDIYVPFKNQIKVMASIGIDSNTTYSFVLDNKRLLLLYTFKASIEDKLKFTPNPGWKRCIMEFTSTTDIVTAYYHQENQKKEDGYYYFLDATGLVTVTRRMNASGFESEYESKDLYSDRFEVNLSSFVVCHFKQKTSPTEIGWNYSIIIALCLGATVVPSGLAIYFYCAMNIEKAKRKDLKKKNRQNMSNLSSSSFGSSNLNSSSISSGTSSSNASSNAFTLTSNPTTTSSTSMASKGSSVLQSVKSSITSLLNQNKSKQAKTAAKAKNSKAKVKKPKSPK